MLPVLSFLVAGVFHDWLTWDGKPRLLVLTQASSTGWHSLRNPAHSHIYGFDPPTLLNQNSDLSPQAGVLSRLNKSYESWRKEAKKRLRFPALNLRETAAKCFLRRTQIPALKKQKSQLPALKAEPIKIARLDGVYWSCDKFRDLPSV